VIALPEKYPIIDIEILELGDSTSKFIEGFECDIKELTNFLQEDALKQMKEAVNRTFLWMSRKDQKLIAYVTICSDAINLDSGQKEEMLFRGIRYKSLPAMKICRMGVRKDLMRRGLGTKMIAFAINRALKIHQEAACRYITLDAKNDEKIPEHSKPIHFYKSMEFKELKRRKKDNVVHMYKDLYALMEPRLKP
jgi:GNAT superfamily N-acetyltransferase